MGCWGRVSTMDATGKAELERCVTLKTAAPFTKGSIYRIRTTGCTGGCRPAGTAHAATAPPTQFGARSSATCRPAAAAIAPLALQLLVLNHLFDMGRP